eukprot:1159388-Pelagomonas_calceolata.AAC.5
MLQETEQRAHSAAARGPSRKKGRPALVLLPQVLLLLLRWAWLGQATACRAPSPASHPLPRSCQTAQTQEHRVRSACGVSQFAPKCPPSGVAVIAAAGAGGRAGWLCGEQKRRRVQGVVLEGRLLAGMLGGQHDTSPPRQHAQRPGALEWGWWWWWWGMGGVRGWRGEARVWALRCLGAGAWLFQWPPGRPAGRLHLGPPAAGRPHKDP